MTQGKLSPVQVWISPLYGFDIVTQIHRIDLGDGVNLIRMEDDFKEALAWKPDLQKELQEQECKWAIEISYILTDSALQDALDAKTLKDIITVLRLGQQGDIAPGPIFMVNMNKKPPSVGILFYHEMYSSHHSVIHKYELTEMDITDLTVLWQEFRNKRKLGKLDALNIAIDRFNSSYRGRYDDMLIDQMIALESLYIGDNQELTYKLALRAAFLLGGGQRERRKIFDRLKKAYGIRSKIVHGSPVPADIGEVVDYTEDYLRKSLVKFIQISDKYSLNQIRETLLDQNIIQTRRLLK